jgi:hypothetical protein
VSKRNAPTLPRISESQIVALVKAGKYKVCRQTATVIGPRGKPIKPHPCKSKRLRTAGDECRRFVRLYGFGGVRTIALARLVWISVVGEPLPSKDWEVHHRDECNHSDGWDNLIAVHKLDHRKLHNGHSDEGIPY